MNPRISILVACYNAAGTIHKCINSILSQTDCDAQVIACDDGSTDGTQEALRSLAEGEKRVVLLRSDVSQGAAAARNRCLRLATGRYVAIQDADDYSAPERLQKQAAFLDCNPDFAFVSAGVARFDEQGEWCRLRPGSTAPGPVDLLPGSPFVHAATMFRREALEAVGGYRVSRETRRGQDYDLFLRLYAAGYRGANLPDILYYYRQDRAGFSRKRYRFRLGEVLIRLRGYRGMRLLARGLPYLFKPLLAGLLPAPVQRRRLIRRSEGPARVLQVVSSLGYGGVAHSLRTFARHIDPARVRFDYFVHLGEPHVPPGSPGAESRVFVGRRLGEVGAARYCAQWCRLFWRHPYDAVVIHTNYQAGLVALCARIMRVPTRVCHIRGSYIANRRVRPLLPLCRGLLGANATHRWACSEQAGRFYFGRRSFTVIPEPIELASYGQANPGLLGQLRVQLDIPAHTEVWGQVGRFTPEKNHFFTLQLLRGRLAHGAAAILVLAGDGPLLAECRREAVRLGVIDFCRFLGNRDDLPTLMQLFDILLLPSLSEGFPNAAVEAQAAGIPALLSDRLSKEVDFGAGLVAFARHGDCADWLEHIERMRGARADRQEAHRLLAARGYEAASAAGRMQAFFEEARR